MLFKGYFRISERNFCYILFKYFVQCIFLVLCTFSSLLVRIYSSSLWNRYIWMKMFYSFCTDFNIALKVLGYLRSSCVRPLLIEYTVNLKSAFSSMSSDPLSWIVCTQLFDKKCPFTAAPTQFFGVYSLFCYAKNEPRTSPFRFKVAKKRPGWEETYLIGPFSAAFFS